MNTKEANIILEALNIVLDLETLEALDVDLINKFRSTYVAIHLGDYVRVSRSASKDYGKIMKVIDIIGHNDAKSYQLSNFKVYADTAVTLELHHV